MLKETDNNCCKLLAINGTERVSYNSHVTFNKHSLNIDNQGTLYGITNNGKLWRGNINGNCTELNIGEIDQNSLFTCYNEEYIITNN